MTDPLRAVLDRATPEPPRPVDLDAVLRGAARRRAHARRRLVVGASAAVAAVAALAVALATLLPASSRNRPSPPVAGPELPGTTTSPPTTADHERQTVAALDRILGQLPVYPGSRVAARADHPYLTGPLSFPAGGIDRGSTRLTHGTVADARRYIRTHLPTGWTAADGGSMSGPDIPTTLSDSITGPAGWQQSDAYTALTVDVSYAVDAQARLEIRADVQALPLPARTADQRIPTSRPLGAELTRNVEGQVPSGMRPHSTATLTGSRALRLADDLNSLGVDMHGPHCPLVTYGATTTIRFFPDYDNRGDGGAVATAVVSSSQCETTVAIGRGPKLAGDARLDADLNAALHR